MTSVRPEYMPLWKELAEMVPFKAWVFNSADANYSIEFKRTYYIIPQFRVIDSNGKIGKDTDDKQIQLK